LARNCGWTLIGGLVVGSIPGVLCQSSRHPVTTFYTVDTGVFLSGCG